MTNTQPPQDRPLVTFALFAYNQEKYIREAVEGAFAQIYEPLEIILSDDCSSDRTFEIMQEMAAGYVGPHEVRVRRNEVNVGTLSHVLQVAHAATSDIIVVAAGDDISFPRRSEIALRNLVNEDVYAMSSDDIIIDEFGQEMDWDVERDDKRDAWHSKIPTWVHGATAAYRANFLRRLPLPKTPIFYEDMVFSDILSAFEKKSIRLQAPLIYYRYHLNNLSDRLNENVSIESAELKSIERWRRAHDAKVYCINTLSICAGQSEKVSPKVLKRLMGEERCLFHALNWRRNSFLSKLKYIYYAGRYGDIKSSLIRVLGSSSFHALKTVKRLRNGA